MLKAQKLTSYRSKLRVHDQQNACLNRNFQFEYIYLQYTYSYVVQVIQRREDGTVDFYRDWDSYARGFGDVSKEFWLGDVPVHVVCSMTKA